MEREEVFNILRNRGIREVCVSFSGGNDEGSVEGIEITFEDNAVDKEYSLDTYYGTSRWDSRERRYVQSELTPIERDKAELSKALQEPIYNKYGSFAGEFTVQGELIWDVPHQRVHFSGQEMDWQSFSEEA